MPRNLARTPVTPPSSPDGHPETRESRRTPLPVRRRLGLRLAFLIACAVSLTACEVTSHDETSQLDRSLEEALRSASPDGDVGHFLLPESDDLAAIPQDPRNPITPAKVELGKLLFHESGLAVDPRRPGEGGTWSCASCHHARAGFQAGVRQGVAEGGSGFGRGGEGRILRPDYNDHELDVQPIRSPTIMNSAYQEVMLWNGQFGATGVNADTRHRWTPGSPKEVNFLGFEGVETQSIASMGVHRMGSFASGPLMADPVYAGLWEQAFPGRPVNLIDAALAIAAYERTLLSNRAPFQLWLRGRREAMTARQKEGALLFFGKANCHACHTGPALNSMTFHALGMADLAGPDIRFDPRDLPKPLGRAAFTLDPDDSYGFKTPQLYNLADAVFLGHGASFVSVRDVVQYKNLAIPETSLPAAHLSELFVPLGLTEREVDLLTAFVAEALRDPRLDRYEPDWVPSGSCIPNNDPASRIDLGCVPLLARR